VFLIATIPATMVVNKITLPANLQLGDISGSVWSGKVEQVLYDNMMFENVKWTFSISKLFLGQAGVDIKFGNRRKIQKPYGTLNLHYGLSGLAVGETHVSLPADLIKSKLQEFMIEDLQGRLKIDLELFTFGKPYCQQVVGHATWVNPAIMVMGSGFLLGDLKSKLSCNKGNLVMRVTGDEAVLDIDAKIELYEYQQVKISGTIKPGEEAEDTLVSALGFIGQADEEGRYRIDYDVE
jgi:general secretion pathway protein N